MNKIYRKAWSKKLLAFVAVSEVAKSKFKGAGCVVGILISGVFLGQSAGAQSIAPNALPTGAKVREGLVSLQQTGSTLNVNQNSLSAAINWATFNVGKDATVNFNHVNSSAVTLNRVVGTEASMIDGAIRAIGSVWILNTAGVLFNNTAKVDVGSLVASTLNISDADFMSGKRTFESNGTRGKVLNLGSINVANGGYAALIGQAVSNQGYITATMGSAMMAAGDKVSLNFNGNSLIGITIDRGTLDALVENKQAIYADGGVFTSPRKRWTRS